MRKLRMPSHGTVVAYAALFVSLGGTAVALERASVTSREIATGAVRSSEIATGAVKRSEIKTGAVGPAEVRTDAVRSREIRSGAVAASELASNAVERAAIADAAVGAQQIQAGAIGPDALAADSVDGTKVADGSLELGDVAEVVANVTYDPPVMSPGDCQADQSIAVPNKQAGDVALVLPGSGAGPDGWDDEFTLRGYASNGSGAGNTISVVVCRPFGAGPIDAGPQPLSVLLFR